MTDYYDKPDWRKRNQKFLSKVFGTLPGSYVELIGGHNPGDTKGKDQMYHMLRSSNIINNDTQFIGVDSNPVVLYHRVDDKPNLHKHPLIFGDVFHTIRRIQKSQGSIKDITGEVETKVDPRVVAINFDVGKKVVLSPDNENEWWTSHTSELRSVVREAWQYTSRIAFIGNFSRDHGSESIDNPNINDRIRMRKGYLIESIKRTFGIPLLGKEESIINSFDEYHCRGQMISTRFVLTRKRVEFYTPESTRV